MRRRSSNIESAAAKPRKGPGRQSPDQTQQRNLELLEKALDLFLENGFDGTSIDSIAAAVGMAKRTVYLRHGNKTKLFKTALQRAIEAWILPVERLRAAESDDFEQTLLDIGHLLVENVVSPAGLRLMRITNAESPRMPEIGKFTYSQGTAPTLEYLTDLIRRRTRAAGTEVTDPERAAVAFLNLVVGGPASVMAWGIALDRTEIQQHTRYCVLLFLHGLMNDRQRPAWTRTTQRRGREDKPIVSHGRANSADAAKVAALQEENRRLKVLLADSVLEIAALKDRKR